jgi:ABC-2 type transport system permease protein
MTTNTVARPPSPDVSEISPARVFAAVLWRDIFVTGRELPVFLAQVLLQPLFLLFIFGKVLTSIGATHASYADLLFPGTVALAATLTALQGTALPLVLDFSFSREIEDRLLAPIPLVLVAVEKMVFATLRGVIAAGVMFPLGYLMLGSLHIHAGGIPLVVVVVILGATLGAALGLVLGTWVPPTKISVMFALILTPLLFTGCTQYPWPSLSSLRWFQVITTLNPLTYVSESLRAAIIPSEPHMHLAITLPVLIVEIIVLTVIGLAGFTRRAID